MSLESNKVLSLARLFVRLGRFDLKTTLIFNRCGRPVCFRAHNRFKKVTLAAVGKSATD